MIEVHNPGRIGSTAVRAGSTSKIAQKLQSCPLAPRNSGYLFSAVDLVVSDVVRTLVSFGSHVCS